MDQTALDAEKLPAQMAVPVVGVRVFTIFAGGFALDPLSDQRGARDLLDQFVNLLFGRRHSRFST